VIRFLLDMGIARSSAAFLRAKGHDVVHLSDEGLERMSDDRIVEKALAEKRVIVTHDLDFGRIVALSGDRVPSIITFRLSDMTPASVNAALVAVLQNAAALSKGSLATVTDRGVRLRSLPISRD